MANKVTVDFLRQQIARLMLDYPDLVDDPMLHVDMLIGSTTIEEQLTELARVIDDAKGLITGTEERLDELKQRKVRFGRRIDCIRDFITAVLEEAAIAKIELPEVTLLMRKNQKQIIGEIDPDALPDHLVRITRTANRTAIKEALEAGDEVPGCFLSNAPPSLVVKVK